MNQLISSLAKVCQAYPLKEKLLIVPSYQAGQEMLQSLSLAGTAWVNLKSITIDGLALDLISSDLAKTNTTIINEKIVLSLIETIVADLKKENKLEYFGQIELSGQVLSIMAASLNDLRRIGIGSTALKLDDFVSTAKGQDIKEILVRYEQALQRNNYIDMPGVYHVALEKVKGDYPRKDVLYLLADNLTITSMEVSFLEKASSGNIIKLAIDPVYGLDRPNGNEFTLDTLKTKSDSEPTILSWLYAPEKAPSSKSAEIAIFRAYGITNEVKEVLRNILYNKYLFDHVEIICTAEREYVHTFYIECQKLGIPITFSNGIPVSLSKPGRLLAGLLQWIGQDFNSKRLRELLVSGDASLDLGGRVVARLIRSASIGWGRDRYAPCLENLITMYREKIDSVDLADESKRIDTYKDKLLIIESLKKEMTWVFNQLPVCDDQGYIDFSKITIGLSRIMKRWKNITNEVDAQGYAAIYDGLMDYTKCSGLMLTMEAALEKISTWLNSLSVQRSIFQPGHVHLTSCSRAGWSNRDSTFVVGLAANYFPGAGLQDPILLDQERMKISHHLSLHASKPRENIYQLAQLLASLRGNITFSYPTIDTLDCQTIFPATIMLQVYRLLKKDAGKSYSDLYEDLDKAIGYVVDNERSLDEHDWWLSSLYPVLKNKGIDEQVQKCYPQLRRGAKATAARGSSKLSNYDGKISICMDKFNPCKNHQILMSCSRIESLAKCPFSYFLRYIMRIESPEDVEYDSNQWLDALARGSLLHDVYYQFMAAITEKNERAQYPKHLKLLQDITADKITEYKNSIPPPSTIVFEWEKGLLYQACEIFLKVEADSNDGVPKYFELPFGMGADTVDKSNIGQQEPVQIELHNGENFCLRGRIDRIDEVKSGTYRIWDYKTGSTYGYDENGFIKNGKQLQHALYSMAVRQMLKGKTNNNIIIELAGYLFYSEKGEGKKIAHAQDREQDVITALTHLFEIIANGNFHATDIGDACKFCEYQVICNDMPDNMKMKLEDSDNTCLNSWKGLKNFE